MDNSHEDMHEDDDYEEDSDTGDDKIQSYRILNLDDIRRAQEEDILELSNTLSIPTSDSCTLLRHYNWDINKVHDQWFADETKVRETVGLVENPVVIHIADPAICGICLRLCSGKDLSASTCGHHYCRDCWRGYIISSINCGPGCLMLRCPEPSCTISIGRKMVNSILINDEKLNEKYRNHLSRSYVEDQKKAKWCPVPGCEFAVIFEGGSIYDILCRCGHAFCWNCTEEAHRPVDCEKVSRWILKNSSESENVNWILVNSKPCPQCRRPIEKNGGCMHMRCSVCMLDFCWLCFRSYNDHTACNRFKQGEVEEETRRKRAKLSNEKYTHYWERWDSNLKSRKKAYSDLQSMQEHKVKVLREKSNLPESQVKFVIEAWEQIVACRKVLTWTYVHGYYLDEDEEAKKKLFEYLQGEAEVNLERLHKCAEIDTQDYLDGKLDDFLQFRCKLAGLTRVTGNYFSNLVRALENGLEEVDSRKPMMKNKDGEVASY